MNTRDKCVVCGSIEMGELFTLKMPSFMGVVDKPKIDKLHNMNFTECSYCGNVQLKDVLPLEIVYQNNHNIDIVGKTWENHYKELSEFIRPHIGNKTVLEISDPSAKIARTIADTCNKWYIVEPNPDMDSYDNVEFIEEFFDGNFESDYTVDVIVHSHFFEHTYDPVKFLADCYRILEDGGEMFMSIPNLNDLLDNGVSPNAILHFEHTYFYDDNKLEMMLGTNGFEIINRIEYGNHSLFYHVVKTNKKLVDVINNNPADRFKNSLEKHKGFINRINKELEGKDNVFLYGSHVTSQFYIFNGLDITRFKGVLDNSESKQGKYLYGTTLEVFNPNTIDSYDSVVILCSHMGIYFEEIKSQLMKLNKTITLL